MNYADTHGTVLAFDLGLKRTGVASGDLSIGVAQATLGAKVEVQTLDGPATIQIPPGTRSGQRLRLKGRGIPGKPAGDLYAVVKIVVPPVESERLRELYEELSRESRFDPRAKMKG